MKPTYVDLHSISENRRIDLIAHQIKDHKSTVGFIVEDDPKADRYISKLKALVPNMEIVYRGPGPVPATILVKVRTPQD
jgi:hypothetical protein